ncbi:hypothetical protein BST61_g3950 [Cercospora zeina]
MCRAFQQSTNRRPHMRLPRRFVCPENQQWEFRSVSYRTYLYSSLAKVFPRTSFPSKGWHLRDPLMLSQVR